MFITKDTEEATNKKFAVNDISRRAKIAYEQNAALFNAAEHKATVARVVAILTPMFADVEAVYETARPASKKFPAHTEVKFNKVTLYNRDKHATLKRAVLEELAQLGLDLEYKPGTNSYSVKIK